MTRMSTVDASIHLLWKVGDEISSRGMPYPSIVSALAAVATIHTLDAFPILHRDRTRDWIVNTLHQRVRLWFITECFPNGILIFAIRAK